MSTSLTMLTAEEAAEIARCSVTTVRRAYATGALTAYRRRGSRAILLDNDDVLAWARGEIIKPTSSLPSEREHLGAKTRATGARHSDPVSAPRPAGQARFDLSVAALRERRIARTQTST